MYFDSSISLWQFVQQYFTHIVGNAVLYNKVIIQIGQGWNDGNWPLFFSSFLEAFWSTIWWDNLLYDPESEAVPTTPAFNFNINDYIPDFLLPYLAAAPSFEKPQ